MSIINTVLNFLYPPRCVSCQKAGRLLCEECRNRLPSLEEFYCVVCDRPAVLGFTHPICRTRYTPERALSAFAYKGPARKLVGALKYRKLYPLAEMLAELLVEDLGEKGVEFGAEAIVVPVPLSFWREGARGFNQAALLGKALAQRLGLPFRPELLQRVKDTPSQVGLKREERARNIRGAFEAKPLAGEDVLLVDDVLTTGATAREAAKVLKKAGAGQVWVITFAKD